MKSISHSAALGLMTAMLTTGAVHAQKQTGAPQAGDRADALLSSTIDEPSPNPPVPVNDGEAYHRADDAEQDPAELRTTQALNDEIASRNDLAAAQERADQANFEAERAKHEAVVAQATADRLAYEENLRQAQAAQRRWEAERARWEADVRACEAGDRTRCAPPR